MVKNKRYLDTAFYRPIRLKEYSFFFKRNSLGYSRLITVIPKYIIKHSNKRNKIRRILKNFFSRSNLSTGNLDTIIFFNKFPKNANDILYIINKIWIKFF